MAEVTIGWDVGGAHLKACLAAAGQVVDVAQWPCALWQGLDRLDAALAAARERWSAVADAATRHAATMTGEMVDLFADRAQGVAGLAHRLTQALGTELVLYAGPRGWVTPPCASARWADVASANWFASAVWTARRVGDGLLVDVGSTTTDVVPLRDGAPAPLAFGDGERLASGELVYQGVARTPLCALGPRVPFGARQVNVMNEWFATTADVYRLTGELDAAHDQHPPADGGAKDTHSTCQRLARMIGRDAHDADTDAWRALARHWRQVQLDEIDGQVARVLAGTAARDGVWVGAGCGDFVAATLAARHGRPYRRFADTVPFAPQASAHAARWAQVCAPAVAVALLASEHPRHGAVASPRCAGAGDTGASPAFV